VDPGGSERPDSVAPPVDVTPATPEDPEFVAAPTLVRRLTHDEYRFTVADVLGVTLSADDLAELPADRPLAGFVKIASGQSTAPEHVRAYALLAERIASDPAAAAFVARHVPCSETTTACGASLVDRIGRVLFRRPLTEQEHIDFGALFDAVTGHGADVGATARAVVSAMLQSPQFLYLLELEARDGYTGLRVVDGYEMASRLSYLLWASAPDDALYAAAEDGTLETAEGISAATERMLLDDDKTRRVVDRFMLDWALLESLPDDDGRRQDLVDGAVAFYSDHVRNARGLFELLTAERAFLTPAIAEAYGLTSLGDGLREYSLSEVPGRIGLLAQPGVVAGMTNADGGEIVARGLFLQRQIFCGEPPAPPASLQDAIDAFVAEQPETASQRQIAEARLMRSECSACHAHFDPLAYGFEQLDFRGAYRTEDEHGNTLTTDGWIPGSQTGTADVPYESLDDYMPLLAEQERVRDCMVRRQLEYALGHRLEAAHHGSVRELTERVANGGESHEQLLRRIVAHDIFRLMQMTE
jgi:hypothetical protein